MFNLQKEKGERCCDSPTINISIPIFWWGEGWVRRGDWVIEECEQIQVNKRPTHMQKD